jgi:hypothetical protein
MARRILGVVAGLAAWVAVASVAGVIMRGTWREYANVADAMTFTLPMMIARLSIGVLASFAAGALAGFVARRSTLSSLTTGVILLVLFIPQHIMLWAKFPVWYHLTFLFSLVPSTYLGGKIASRWHTVAAPRSEPTMPVAQRSSGRPA